MNFQRFIRCFSSNTNPIKRTKFNNKKMGSQKKKPFTIIVEGNIGCGKTTFLNNFKSNKNILTVTEPVEAWKNIDGHNLLELMYCDFKSWAFTFQTYVQLTMMKLHAKTTDRPVKIIERSLYSARFVFVDNLLQMNVLSPPQVAVLDEWYQWLLKRNEIPVDLIVYLRTEPEVVYQRIKERNRQGESLVTLDYLKRLHQCHEDWLYKRKKFHCPAPVLFLDANKDLENIKEEYKFFQSKVDLLKN